MNEDASFGRMIKRLRRTLDLTQQDLARRIGYSVATVRKIESDERRPSRDLAERLAMGLDVARGEWNAFLAMARALPPELGQAAPVAVQVTPVADSEAEAAPQPDRQSSAGIPTPGTPEVPVPTNLSTPLTRLIGRYGEEQAVRTIIQRGDVRLVTLVGPPGIGKSRLSLQVAGDLRTSFPDGVFTVALSPISDPALVMPTVAKTLGVKESAAQSLIDCLIDYLRTRRLLLVIDNFEHMLPAAPQVAEILTACPSLSVLATSREPLHVRGEQLFPVPPLALPDPSQPARAATVARSAAVELFVERAQAVSPGFELTDANADDIAAICANLEGLPLAIELVAARIKLLPPQALLSRLDSRLALLTGGPRDLPARQQTLRSTIDWSYQLLDEEEQALFARLAVFIGGCRIEAAERTGNADGDLALPVLDGLAALADKNLLRQEERCDGERYFTFFETIREFALERLAERGEERTVRERYSRYYLDLADEANEHLAGEDQERWFDQLEAEHNNLRSVLEYHITNAEAAPALRLVSALWRFWHIRSHQTEGGRWIALALGLQGAHEIRHRAQALIGAGWIAYDQSDWAHSRTSFSEGLALFRESNDVKGVAEALHGVGMQEQANGGDAKAATLFEESLELYRTLDDQEGIAWSLDHLGSTALFFDDRQRALRLLEESNRIFRQLGHTWGIALSLHHQGLTMLASGEHRRALGLLNDALSLFDELGNSWGVAVCYYHLGHVALSAEDLELAETHFRRSLAMHQAEEDRSGIYRCLSGLGSVAVVHGHLERAAHLFGAVEAYAERNTLRMTPLETAIHARNVQRVRDGLNEEGIKAAWTAGQGMTLAQVAQLALAP